MTTDSSQRSVIVIGAGVIGVCSAYFLAEKGMRVTLVDQDDVCSGSSYGNAGLLVPSHSVPLAAPGVIWQGLRWMFNPESPFYIKPRLSIELISWLWRFRAACNARQRDRAIPVLRDLILKSAELYDAFAWMPDMDFPYTKAGLLYLLRTAEGLREVEHEVELLRGAGLEAEMLGPDAIQERMGAEATVVGGVYYPQDAHIVPDRFVRTLAAKLESMGVLIKRSTGVTGFRSDRRRIATVQTDGGELEADEVVLAAGSWTPSLARRLGIKVPIQAAKGYSVTYEAPAGAPRMPVICGEARVAVTPMVDRLRFAGTLELAGMDRSISDRRVKAIVGGVGGFLPGVRPSDMKLIETWTGLRPLTPDGLPMLGRSPAYDNLTLAAGHATVGMSSGPASGKLVAQVVAGEPPFADLTLLDPGRFG